MNTQANGKTMPSVVCVVLNYNGAADTVECVRSLLAQSYAALHVTIVDNQSTDDSVDVLRAEFPDVELIVSGTNGGFAAGCNVGIRPALATGAAYVWLLNNDTIAPPGTLRSLVDAAESGDGVGVAGTVLYYQHAPEKVQAWGGGRIGCTTGFGRHYTEPAVLGRGSFVTFASALLRCEMLREVGLLDENYFMYFEDSDFCFRAREAGWDLAVAADTAVLHKEGGSVKTRGGWTDRITTASGMRFLAKFGVPRTFAPWIFVLTRLGKRLVRLDFRAMRSVWQGVSDWRRETPRAFQAETGDRA